MFNPAHHRLVDNRRQFQTTVNQAHPLAKRHQKVDRQTQYQIARKA
jgi:hypothetical protein